jgi:transcriptional regulator with PAS, ATPase and Fis domain
MALQKRTIMIRDDFYERLRRDAFFGHKDIKDILDGILADWITEHPEEEHRPAAGKLRENRASFEIEEIKNAMAQARNHRAKAAEIMEISRMALFMKMKKYNLQFPDYLGRKKAK